MMTLNTSSPLILKINNEKYIVDVFTFWCKRKLLRVKIFPNEE